MNEAFPTPNTFLLEGAPVSMTKKMCVCVEIQGVFFGLAGQVDGGKKQQKLAFNYGLPGITVNKCVLQAFEGGFWGNVVPV